MTRYKGRAGLKVIESKFPHHIDMLVPEGGFGGRLNAMHDWHDTRGIPAVRGQSRRENGRDIIRWCFADPAVAEAFADKFNELPHNMNDPCGAKCPDLAKVRGVGATVLIAQGGATQRHFVDRKQQ